jgi:hypothetical protein
MNNYFSVVTSIPKSAIPSHGSDELTGVNIQHLGPAEYNTGASPGAIVVHGDADDNIHLTTLAKLGPGPIPGGMVVAGDDDDDAMPIHAYDAVNYKQPIQFVLGVFSTITLLWVIIEPLCSAGLAISNGAAVLVDNITVPLMLSR